MKARSKNFHNDVSPTVALAIELIRCPSITPIDAGCQEILIQRLAAMGFTIHRLRFGAVENFYARLGHQGKNFCFAGHTDVVPPGDDSQWKCEPFAGEIQNGHLIGRGVADMKGGLAAMVVACERFLTAHPNFIKSNSLSFLVTGDEEGEAVDGTVKILDWLTRQGESLDYCLVGEPTSNKTLGDCYKHGRRGSINGTLAIHGRLGHVAHAHLATNPIHLAMPVLDKIATARFDKGNLDFPPSTIQITSLQAGVGANNVIPELLTVQFNIRFSPASTPESLETTIRSILDEAKLPLGYDLTMTISGLPFITHSDELGRCLDQAVRDILDTVPIPSTGGGTSDARFISRFCPQILELGLVGNTIHKVNESVRIEDLNQLTIVYQRVLEILFAHYQG